jgi:hypothetical protein
MTRNFGQTRSEEGVRRKGTQLSIAGHLTWPAIQIKTKTRIRKKNAPALARRRVARRVPKVFFTNQQNREGNQRRLPGFDQPVLV